MRKNLFSNLMGAFALGGLMFTPGAMSAQTLSYNCTVDLLAGQHILVGEVSVSSDADSLYVNYTTNGGWTITETHLYVGDCNSIPTAGNNNNPVPGQFPHKSSHSNATSVTYAIALDDVDSCFCVAAHAVVNNNGQSETAWGDGQRFTTRGNWATYFECCGEDDTIGYNCTSDLLVDQQILVGVVSVSSDADSLYVNYSTNGGWTMTETHLYVGDCNSIPTTGNNNNPILGQFPHKSSHNNVTSVTYAIALDEVDSCFCVAAHAEVIKDGQGSESAWGDGQRFSQQSNRMATYFQCCDEDDIPPPPPVTPSSLCSPDSLVDVNQTTTKTGGTINEDRSDPYNAVGPPQQCGRLDPVCFFSLGFGGSITLGWSDGVFMDQPGNDLLINEISYGQENKACSSYPELAEIAVSQDNVTYYVIDTVCRTQEVDIAVSGLPWIRYIRVTDVSDPDDFENGPTTDGYDLNGIECVPLGANKRGEHSRAALNNNFMVYPNPASGSVTLKAEVALKQFEETKVDIYDMYGKLVYTTSYHGQVEQTIDISHFTSGMYMIHFDVDGVREVQKLMVQ